MSNMNSYTDMHNHKVLNKKTNESGISNCNCRNKDTCLYQIVVKRNAEFIKPALTVISLDINKNVTLAHVKTFKGRFGNHKISFNHVKHKNDTNLSK